MKVLTTRKNMEIDETNKLLNWAPQHMFTIKQFAIDGHILKITAQDGTQVEIRFNNVDWKCFEALMSTEFE